MVYRRVFAKVCETKGVREKISSRRLKVESGTPQTGDRLMPGGGSMFDRVLIVISHPVFYHTSTYEVKKILQVFRNEEVGGGLDWLRPL